MIDNWGTDESLCDIGPMPWGDGIIDMKDLEVWIKYWEQETSPQTPEENLIEEWKQDETKVDIFYNSIIDFDGRR